jgi:hypothetical protein
MIDFKLKVCRAMGSPARKNTDLVYCRKVEIECTHAAAEAFSKNLAPQLSQGKSFRFIYLSGMFAERMAGRRLWFLHDSRTIKVHQLYENST